MWMPWLMPPNMKPHTVTRKLLLLIQSHVMFHQSMMQAVDSLHLQSLLYLVQNRTDNDGITSNSILIIIEFW